MTTESNGNGPSIITSQDFWWSHYCVVQLSMIQIENIYREGNVQPREVQTCKK